MSEDREEAVMKYLMAGCLLILGAISLAMAAFIGIYLIIGFWGISLVAKLIWVVSIYIFVKAVKFVAGMIEENDWL